MNTHVTFVNSFWGFPGACPEGSRLRRWYEGLEIDALPPGPSYVANHLKTMDMCENPEWQYLHGEHRRFSGMFLTRLIDFLTRQVSLHGLERSHQFCDRSSPLRRRPCTRTSS